MPFTVDQVLTDTMTKALVERDGRLWAALHILRANAHAEVLQQVVPDRRTWAPFRATGDAAGSSDTRGVDRTS